MYSSCMYMCIKKSMSMNKFVIGLLNKLAAWLTPIREKNYMNGAITTG